MHKVTIKQIKIQTNQITDQPNNTITKTFIMEDACTIVYWVDRKHSTLDHFPIFVTKYQSVKNLTK